MSKFLLVIKPLSITCILIYQAMRIIINDKRYGALKTLGERKQAFNEVWHVELFYSSPPLFLNSNPKGKCEL